MNQHRYISGLEELCHTKYAQDFLEGTIFKSDDVSMLVHSCGVSQYPQFYDTNKNIYQMLPRLYVGRYSGDKGHKILQQPWIIESDKSVEIFIGVSMSEMTTIKY